MEIKDILLRDEFWETTYNKIIQKKGLSDADTDFLWKLKEVYRDDIVAELLTGIYKWSIPEKKELAKAGTNKKRVVYVYSLKDRFIIGVMYRAFSYYYRDRFSSNCFSYKIGVSTNDAIKFIRDNKNEDLKYGVKVDINSYFNSVSRERVIEMINELFNNGLKNTIENLMLNDRILWNGNEVSEWKSLIPGCALGSFFANYCLRHLDEYFEGRDAIYARYSDDIIVLARDKGELEEYLEIIKEHINKYELTINPSKYTWFEPGDDVEYLGLKLCGNGDIDISDHAKQKIKRQIHRWCRKGRMEIERENIPFEKVAKKIIRQLNNKNMFCIIGNESTFGWCHYAFRYITTIQSLIEIDFYTRDTIRAMKTGKHNKANVKAISDEEFKSLGWISLVDMYKLYKYDFDYYIEIVELMKNT